MPILKHHCAEYVSCSRFKTVIIRKDCLWGAPWLVLGDLILDWVLTISWSGMYKTGLNARLNILKGMDFLHEGFYTHFWEIRKRTHTHTQVCIENFLMLIFSLARKHIFAPKYTITKVCLFIRTSRK